MIDPAFIPRALPGPYRFRRSRPGHRRRGVAVLRGFAVFLSILIGLLILNTWRDAGADPSAPPSPIASALEGQAQ